MGEHMPDYRAAFLNNAVRCVLSMMTEGSAPLTGPRQTIFGCTAKPGGNFPALLFGSRGGNYLWWQCTSGQPVLIAADAVPVSWHGGGAHLLAAVDVTGHATESARLRTALEHIEMAEEGAGIGFWDVFVKEKALSVDKGWAHLIGYEAEELGASFEEVFMHRIHPDDRPMVAAYISRLDDGTTPAGRAEFRMRHRDGRWIWVRSVCRVVAYDGDGAPSGWQVCIWILPRSMRP